MSEDKNLIKYHNNIFTRIKSFFRRLIKNKKSELIDTNTNIPTNIHKNDRLSYLKIINNEELNNNLQKQADIYKSEKEKEEFFKLYEDYKSDKVSIDEIPLSKVIKINKMLEYEIDSKVNDYESLQMLGVEAQLKRNSAN